MKKRILRVLAAGLLVLWCVAFLRTETTEKSQVRALILEPPGEAETGWTVGLLYQYPEAAADAADAAAEVQLCTGEGSNLPQALRAAEKALPKPAGYRLCETILFGPESDLQQIRDACTELQKEPVQGLSAKMMGLDHSGEELLRQEAENLPGNLLKTIEKMAPEAPYLYQSRKAVLLPVIRFREEEPEPGEEGLLLSAQGDTALSSEETQMARLLQEQGGEFVFALGEDVVTIRRCVVSVEPVGEGFRVILTCQRKAGTEKVTQAQQEQLERLCVQTLQHCWQAGYDLLSLSAVRMLRQGSGENALTTENACPQIQADVRFLEF